MGRPAKEVIEWIKRIQDCAEVAFVISPCLARTLFNLSGSTANRFRTGKKRINKRRLYSKSYAARLLRSLVNDYHYPITEACLFTDFYPADVFGVITRKTKEE